ncbi:flagellar basal-body rod protein FlgF [Parvibaculum indicum]|uniref:flagellar basal-body rod protein FlgF n=1 Tax=Parvibaculum indicum TaxID=562969 RepID=UPI00141EEDFA|nr:flagellar basal-body rod protein FlgF [Parvibaculum indicum]NIJ41142.1 flagellar basal-body rod protein FlgF [Parvibaculum indicum]
MENALLIGLSRQMAMQRNMAIIANNLANMNTNGYKSESMLFDEYVMPVASEDSPDKSLSFVQDIGLNRNLADGKLEPTGNPMDVAIAGKGYFKVQTDAGIRYTRNGHFSLDAQGRLVDVSGNPVLDDNGSVVTFRPDEQDIAIARDGTISTDQGQRGTLGLVEFDNERLLKAAGGTLYTTDQPEVPVEKPHVVQGALEGSNVNAILQMTNMIDVTRSYASAQKLVDSADRMRRDAISKLGQAA